LLTKIRIILKLKYFNVEGLEALCPAMEVGYRKKGGFKVISLLANVE